jgi:hypothetical protein
VNVPYDVSSIIHQCNMGVSMIKFVLAILLSLRVMSLHAMPEDTTNTQQDQPPGLITFPQFSIIGKWNYQIPGEKDCDGEVSQSGTSAVHYVRFDETGNSLVMCQDESAYLEQCFGPLYRSEL